MKFSLKAYLITLCVGGAVLGGMSKLFLEEPEIFLRVLVMACTIAPFALAVGTIVWLGLKQPRRWNLVAWGGALGAAPLVAIVSLATMSGNPNRMLSTPRLIANRLPSQVDTPWVWNELADRATKGKLTQEQVDAALDTLITHMKTTKPGGWNQPLSWQHGFLDVAGQEKLLSNEQLVKLCEAFYGTQPKVEPIPATLAGQQGIPLSIEFGNPWGVGSGIDLDLLWDVTQVSLDGAPVKLNSTNRFAQHWSGIYNGQLDEGEHEFEIDVECAFVDSKMGIGTNGRPLPTAQWPKGKKRWSVKLKAPVSVRPATPQVLDP